MSCYKIWTHPVNHTSLRPTIVLTTKLGLPCGIHSTYTIEYNINGKKLKKNSPVLDAVERLFVGDVVHEYEPHGAPVIRRRDSPVTFLARRVL